MSEKKLLILNGHNILTIEKFYDEFQKVLCPNFKYFGRNWNAVNDVLRGGFGVYEIGEEVIIQIKYKNYIIKHLGENVLNKFEKIVRKHETIELIYSNE